MSKIEKGDFVLYIDSYVGQLEETVAKVEGNIALLSNGVSIQVDSLVKLDKKDIPKKQKSNFYWLGIFIIVVLVIIAFKLFLV